MSFNNAGNTKLRGDCGLFRGALLLAGFLPQCEYSIFNDNHKDGSRRLKLWRADAIFESSQRQQKVLEQHLRETFGNSIRSMYFVEAPYWLGSRKSLCIQLAN